MARTETLLEGTPERVFTLLGDPRSLAYFVVGTRTIRRFDPRWPDPGTSVHHSVGIGPLVLRDETVVRWADPSRRLVLDARIRPLGQFRVDFTLHPEGTGTRLTVDEYPVAGVAALPVIGTLVDRLVYLRNLEMGRRLRRLVDRREQQRARAVG
jgi:uncharacterized protein YndB with AHSA1/START domain